MQFHSTDATVTATQGVPSGRFGGPRPGMKQRKAEWDALSETEKAALISERRRYCESLPTDDKGYERCQVWLHSGQGNGNKR